MASIRFTQKAQNVLNNALRFARELGHTYIGSEHLLLSLVSEQQSIAANILAERGADPDKLRTAVIEIAGEGTPSNVSAADMTPRTKHIMEAS